MPCIATFRFRCRDDTHLWTEGLLREIPDPRRRDERLLVTTMRDIADRKRLEVSLQRQAMTDPLTGVANRTVFMDRLELALRRLERAGTAVAIVYLDLDRFKVINDSLGHTLGDRLLVKVAERAAACIRPADTLARIGGDEFVILAEGLASLDEAIRLSARLHLAMEAPFDLDGELVTCTTSAGVATTTDSRHGAIALLHEADLALYRAKDRGRNRTEVFDDDLRASTRGRADVEHMIRAAMGEGRLRVHYQPIVDLELDRVVRAEALLRIEHEGELILPGVFMTVAEETGLVLEIDEHVLGHAAAQAAHWARALHADHFQGVAVNVTVRHLADPRFLMALADVLESNRLQPGALAIEITERVLLEGSTAAIDCLRTIRRLGVPVGLDDFGTGYSSLAHLRQLPLDYLKVDHALVHGLRDGASEDRRFVAAIIDLAHALGLWVVAEGVETDEQLAALIDLGCDQAQGFVFGRAVPPDTITELVGRDGVSSVG
jgi:diguanylate cyclase (GGDEF)-like protein